MLGHGLCTDIWFELKPCCETMADRTPIPTTGHKHALGMGKAAWLELKVA